MVLPPNHLTTVSESPGHYGPDDYLTIDKASDFLFRALEAVNSCDCEDGCDNCEIHT